MAEELVSTVGILATSMANCNVVRADENGVVILPEFPKTVGNITLGGGGYIPGQGIVIGEENGTTQSDDVIIGSNITTTDSYYEGGNIAIGNKAEVALGSIAIGSSFTEGNEYTTKATSYNSVAIGSGANASGSWGTALGRSASATGDSSTALGSCACASCGSSTALGYSAIASGDTSTALGYSASASGSSSTAVGRSFASGTLSTALGNCANASGNYSTALGSGANASGNYSTSFGSGVLASGCASTALGHCVYASGDYSTVLGSYSGASGEYSTVIGAGACAADGAVVVTGGASGHGVEGNGNEIVIFSANSCEYEYCETTQAYISCECYGASSYLKVSREGVLTVNDKEMAKKEDIVSQVSTMVANATKVNTTDSNFTLTDVANALNTLIDLLKANQQA